MGNMTLSIPDDIQKEMKQYSDIRWSAIARHAIVERLDMLKLADKLASKSKLTEKDVKDLGDMIKRKAAKRFRECKS